MTRRQYLRSGLAGTLVILGVALAGNVAAVAVPEDPWAPAIQQVDKALARKEYSAALRAANDAYTLAQGTTRWDGMIAAGDLYRRIGEATGPRRAFDGQAREGYQHALFRARRERASGGTLGATAGQRAPRGSEPV